MKTVTLSLGMVFAIATAMFADEAKPVYEAGFEQAALDKAPEDLLVLDGAFAVKEEGGNKFLELPGAPLDTFGVLFGPTESAGHAVTARVHGAGKGRRFPTFGVGLNGVGGYRLQVSPGKKLLELFNGEEMVASAPHTWESGSWTMFRLQCRKVKDDEFKVEGRVWKQGEPEPASWQLTHTAAAALPPGRASLWGNPFAGTPIRFDDLRVAKVAP